MKLIKKLWRAFMYVVTAPVWLTAIFIALIGMIVGCASLFLIGLALIILVLLWFSFIPMRATKSAWDKVLQEAIKDDR
jgi:hypothetical protein